MFTAPYAVAKAQHQLRHPSTDDWRRKTHYVYMREHLAIKKQKNSFAFKYSKALTNYVNIVFQNKTSLRFLLTATSFTALNEQQYKCRLGFGSNGKDE